MKQIAFKKVNGWGGKRKGAGRKNQTGRVSHVVRGKVSGRTPLHITMKLKRGLNGLRSPKMLKQLQLSLSIARKKGLRTIHYSLQSNHLHLFAESESNETLSLGMNSLGARFGRVIRKRLGGRGAVFNGRYHAHILKTPRETRHALAYVLLNKSKHEKFEPEYDDYSSSRHFKEWRQLLRQNPEGLAEGRGDPIPEFLSSPRSWLATAGWKKSA